MAGPGGTINLTEGDDVFPAAGDNTSGDETINGLGGNDSIHGGAGANVIDGGDGNDTLRAGRGDRESLSGGVGDDVFLVDNDFGQNTLDGGAGDDTFIVREGPTYSVSHDFRGGAGVDRLVLSPSREYLLWYGEIQEFETLDASAGKSRVVLKAKQFADFSDGIFAHELVVTSFGGIRIVHTGPLEFTSIYLDTYKRALFDISATDAGGTIGGGEVNDTIKAGQAASEIGGGGGDDRIFGSLADDTITGHGGNDRVDAGDGNDMITGSSGADTLNGGAGNDTFREELDLGEYDSLSPGDAFIGGAGIDRLLLVQHPDSSSLPPPIWEFAGVTLSSVESLEARDGFLGPCTVKLSTEHLQSFNEIRVEGSLFLTDNGPVTLSGSIEVDEFRLADAGQSFDTSSLVESMEILGGGGNDTILTGIGRDGIGGRSGDDSIVAGDGNDELSGDDGADSVHGGNGNDGLSGGEGVDSLFGGDGDDRIGESRVSDVLSGEVYSGGLGVDRLVLEARGTFAKWDLTTVTLDSIERLYLGNFNQSVQLRTDQLASLEDVNGSVELAGNDPISFAGRVRISIYLADGGQLFDSSLNTNQVAVVGSRGNDTIKGGLNRDYLQGGVGGDIIEGGGRGDRLRGEEGNDTLTGGAGADSFYLMGRGGGVEVITDFNAKQDTFAFSPFDFDVGDPLDRHIVFGDAPTDDVGQFLYVVKGGVGLLRWDDDGTGPGGSVLIAKLEGGPVLDVANFTVDGW